MSDLNGVFQQLRELLLEAAQAADSTLHLQRENAQQVVLEHRGQYFAEARLGKRYVSFYLMPLYTDADLLEHIPPELLRRKSGKTCFNFTRLETAHPSQVLELMRVARQRLEQGSAPPGHGSVPTG